MVRFNDKPRHQIFLEPESKHIDEIYVQGFSSSLPRDVQEKMIRTIAGLENGDMNPDIKWAVQYEDSLIQPVRTVIDINMGEYASGTR